MKLTENVVVLHREATMLKVADSLRLRHTPFVELADVIKTKTTLYRYLLGRHRDLVVIHSVFRWLYEKSCREHRLPVYQLLQYRFRRLLRKGYPVEVFFGNRVDQLKTHTIATRCLDRGGLRDMGEGLEYWLDANNIPVEYYYELREWTLSKINDSTWPEEEKDIAFVDRIAYEECFEGTTIKLRNQYRSQKRKRNRLEANKF